MYQNTKITDRGEVISLSDGVVWADGLDGAMLGEVVNFKNGIQGLVFNLESGRVGILVFDNFEKLRGGDLVESTGVIYRTGVSEKLLGRVIDPLGNVLDGEKEVKYTNFYPVEKIAPGIVERQPVRIPLQTGMKAVDAIVPIGRGQRELIIGDRTTGKTALAIDTIINQKDKDVISIYVAIGQKRAKIAQIIQKLKSYGALEKTIIVAATASDSATFRYLAPYVGCAIGEYFMDKGKDVLIVYDDLTKHSWAYREISLLLKRPSGREAYPGDVFYLHSRLLERACKLSEKNGGGSITALPIIETQAGDVSSYIPTNVISITDGQIYLESDLFFAGVRPALNVGLSVSRVGGSAQIKAMKKVAGQLRLDLSQYYELATFAQFSSDLDPETKKKIERGKRIVEILKQPQYSPMPVEKQVMILYLVTHGFVDELPVALVSEFENEFLGFSEKNLRTISKSFIDNGELLKKDEEKLHGQISSFVEDFFVKHQIQKENDKPKGN